MKKITFAVALAFLLMSVGSVLASAQTHTVTLKWTAPTTQTGVTINGYNLYQSTTSGGPYTKVNSSLITTTTFTTGTLSGGTTGGSGVTYFFVATSVCNACSPTESSNSNQAQALVPAPVPPQPNPPVLDTSPVVN